MPLLKLTFEFSVNPVPYIENVTCPLLGSLSKLVPSIESFVSIISILTLLLIEPLLYILIYEWLDDAGIVSKYVSFPKVTAFIPIASDGIIPIAM